MNMQKSVLEKPDPVGGSPKINPTRNVFSPTVQRLRDAHNVGSLKVFLHEFICRERARAIRDRLRAVGMTLIFEMSDKS